MCVHGCVCERVCGWGRGGSKDLPDAADGATPFTGVVSTLSRRIRDDEEEEEEDNGGGEEAKDAVCPGANKPAAVLA